VNVHQGKDIYWVFGAILAAALALGIVAFALPAHARAFSLFGWFTPAAEAGSSAVVPDANLELPAAATNIDPNPNKGARQLALTEGSALISEAGPDGTPPDSEEARLISTYTVVPGDTLSAIAVQFNVSEEDIRSANDIPDTDVLKPGQELVIIPGGVPTDAADASVSAVITKVPPKPSVPKKTVPSKYAGYYGNPVPGGIITQGIHPTNAVDIGAPKGTPIYAAADGTVIVARAGSWSRGGNYGNYVVINHPNGTQTLYAHQTYYVVTVGEDVKKGQLIGYVGMTGDATGPHLHFEVHGAPNPFRNCHVGRVCSPQ